MVSNSGLATEVSQLVMIDYRVSGSSDVPTWVTVMEKLCIAL